MNEFIFFSKNFVFAICSSHLRNILSCGSVLVFLDNYAKSPLLDVLPSQSIGLFDPLSEFDSRTRTPFLAIGITIIRPYIVVEGIHKLQNCNRIIIKSVVHSNPL